MLLLFPEKFLFGLIGHFGPENDASVELWIRSKDFLKTFHNERYKKVMLIVFPKIFSSGQVGHFGPKTDTWSQLWILFIYLPIYLTLTIYKY